MKVALCTCPAPLRMTPRPDPLTCDRCAGITPYGRPWTLAKAVQAQQELTSLVTQLAKDLPWELTAHRPPSNGRRSGVANPTLAAATDDAVVISHAWRQAATRLAERALLYLRLADQAAGEAFLAVDRAPAERLEGQWFPQIVAEAEVERGKAMQAKRRARGEL
jgi:hypothetical protein